jgi:hypothetical protein
MTKRRLQPLAILAATVLLFTSDRALGGFTTQGFTTQGFTTQGFTTQGFTTQGFTTQGFTTQGFTTQGFTTQGFTTQGFTTQGFTTQGFTTQGFTTQGFTTQGFTTQGFTTQGFTTQGIDRLRDLIAPVQFRGIARADIQLNGHDAQGLLVAPFGFASVPYPMANVQLQASPAVTTPGSYIYVPGLSGSVQDIRGSFWNMVIAESCASGTSCTAPASCSQGACIRACTVDSDCTVAGAKCVQGSCTDVEGGIPLYISDVDVDHAQNTSKYSSNDDIFLYTVYYRQPATGQWASLCPVDAVTGKPTAIAVPLDPTDHSTAGRTKFSFACTASGVASKCARNWGYKPWKTVTENVWNGTAFAPTAISLAPFYDACLISARADYCQDDHSYTKNGTLVDLFDTLDGFTSINATAGLPYAPYSSGPMLHEEYQISTGHFVAENYTHDDLVSLSPEDQALVARLRRSGMESSRYADLDPGRACVASPYIDRCDPHEPYACYRATNLNAQAYGAFLAVNSPRHCSHDEEHDGEALDPLCNECVNRVCQIDPSCCGDPGNGFYPGSLVWDARCTQIRQSVCKSDASAPLWPAGETAPAAGSRPVVFLRGAIGAFEGFTTSGGTTFAEGWACDPDHPDASIPVQISVGGALGTAGVTLKTATASEVLAPSWKETVAAECGGGARHGFHVEMPAATTPTDVYVYGIDTDVPGAPFSLLRGGKKTLAASAQTPAAAIWTGWIEPTASGNYVFCKQLPGSSPASCAPNGTVNPSGADLYRLWVNGRYVGGNWKDTNTTVPGAFTLDAPTDFGPQYLLAGVRYGVRVEYQRPAALPASSQFALLWRSPDGSVPGLAAFAQVPATALYPMAQPAGIGLRGTYYAGIDTLGNTAAQAPTQTVSAVDFLWTGKNQPIVGPNAAPLTGFAVGDSFSAAFEGQVVPPISGDYSFTADTDGSVRIFINGQLATDIAGGPPVPDPGTCTHDICRPGAAVSRTCRQGGFCSAQICITDPYCCSVTWDANCMRKVADVCHLDCSPTPPTPISLRAGEKAQIRVEYQHIGTVPNGPTVRGGHLRLEWSLAGTLKEVVPAERLFANGTAPGTGVGLNAAYFLDANFQTEYLDRVEGPLAFAAATPPGPARASSLICSTTACGASGPPAPPALVASRNTSVTGSNVNVGLTGLGAADSATITICDGSTATGSFVPSPSGTCASTTAGVGTTTGGTFTASITLAKGTHTLAARQAAGGQTSDWSAPLAIDAEDPATPPPPTIDAPTGGYLSGNQTLDVSGTAAPGATVTVKIGTTTVGTFTAGADGRWSGTVSLPGPGGYALTVTQTVGGVESTTSAGATARSALPVLTVTSPADGSCISTVAATGCASSLHVDGSGAVVGLGSIHVADGDGRFFTDRATVTVAADGTFAGPGAALDYGRHQLKIFQQTANGDDTGVLRTVLVRPPAVAITAPAPGAIVDATITIVGQGLPRVALAGTAIVYQAGTKLGEVTIAPDGSFQVPIAIVGSGPQTLIIKQAASSLSGGGPAESEPLELPVVVKPGAPTIEAPATGSAHTEQDVAVSVKALPGALVTLIVDDVAGVPLPLTSADHYNGTVHFNTGTHRLRATQTIAGAAGPASSEVLFSVGDVTPPTVRITDTSGAPLRTLQISTSDPTGATVDFAARVSAQDCAAGACVSLTPTCSPASASTFQLGSTRVTCSATDAAGNTGSASFVVTLSPPSTAGPTIDTSDVTVEATSPDGAPAAYQVTATGYVADCAPPGSTEVVPCTSWRPAYAGLGFSPWSVAIDINDPTVAPDGKRHGAIYSGFADQHDGKVQVLKSTDTGISWTKLETPWRAAAVEQIVVGAGSPVSLYVPAVFLGDFVLDGEPLSLRGGIEVSHDGGQSWSAALEGHYIRRLFTDGSDPAHMFATETPYALPPGGLSFTALFETHDAWATWAPVSTDGLPNRRVLDMVIDPLHPDRLFASIDPVDDTLKVQIYRKIGSAPWQRLDIPPYSDVLTFMASRIAIAPALEPGQTFPTVFAGPVYSRDGGETWQMHFLGGVEAVLFDRQVPGALWAAGNSNMFRSPGFDPYTGTYPFDGTSFFLQPVFQALAQDLADPATLYSAYPGGGLYRTVDGGAHWNAVLAPGISLPGLEVADVGFDPVDPQIAYVVDAGSGVFRTDDGGGSWQIRNQGLTTALVSFSGKRVVVDRFNRNNIFLAGPGGLWKSPDGPGTPSDPDAHWTQLNDRPLVGVDTLSPDTAIVSATTGSWPFVTRNNSSACYSPNPTPPSICYQPLSDLVLHNGTQTPGSFWFRTDGFTDQNGAPAILELLQMTSIPAARPTYLMNAITFIDQHTNDSGQTIAATTTPSSYLFERKDLPLHSNVGVGLLPPPVITGIDVGLGTNFIVADASDGTAKLYAGGDDSFPSGSGPVLYAAPVAGVSAHEGHPENAGWLALNAPAPVALPGGGTAPFTNFHRLAFDPGSGGQVMYTVGVGNTTGDNNDTLWESHDGGRTWRRDGAVNVSNVWVSPVDGALYATVANWRFGSPNPYAPEAGYFPGALWKRTLADGTPPGARLVLADLRPNCTSPGTLHAVGPGATFAVGTTTLTCSVTDAFGHNTTRTININVQDTTPPILTVPAQVTGTAPAGGTAAVSFTVTANDAVDGPMAPSCDHVSGAAFPIGVTTVTCIATDSNHNEATASFPVIVSQQGTPTVPPTLTTPAAVTAEATGSNGATLALAVTAATGGATPAPLTPSCTAPIGGGGADVAVDLTGTLFPIDAVDVTCSATAGALTITRSFRVTVKDTTAPALTVPSDFSLEAEGAWGRANVPFTASATDAVDGVVTPSCTPASGETFPIGSTLVTCRAADRAGNRATKTFHVTITGLPPALVLADTTAEATDSLGARVTFTPAPRATDTGNHALTVDCVPTDRSYFPLGDTTVSCSASDGTRESRGSFVVHVVDRRAPDIVVPGPIVVEATGPSGAAVAFAASASDAVDGVCAPPNHCQLVCRRVTGVGLPVAITSPALFPIGDSTVTCDAADSAGNTASATFSVTVRDTTPPTLTVPPTISADADTTGTALVTFSATATDIVGGGIPVGCAPRSGSRFLVGTNAVVCTARDAAGNEASASFNVVVNAATIGKPCASDASCGGGGILCIDGVCCASACGGGNPSDCQACSIAAGGSADGQCTPVAETHVCRASGGACDVAETCDGVGTQCPADAKAPGGTVCRASGGACDVAETCDGASSACPADAKIAAGTTCRASAGACDVAEVCTGVSSVCPADTVVPAGVT